MKKVSYINKHNQPCQRHGSAEILLILTPNDSTKKITIPIDSIRDIEDVEELELIDQEP